MSEVLGTSTINEAIVPEAKVLHLKDMRKIPNLKKEMQEVFEALRRFDEYSYKPWMYVPDKPTTIRGVFIVDFGDIRYGDQLINNNLNNKPEKPLVAEENIITVGSKNLLYWTYHQSKCEISGGATKVYISIRDGANVDRRVEYKDSRIEAGMLIARHVFGWLVKGGIMDAIESAVQPQYLDCASVETHIDATKGAVTVHVSSQVQGSEDCTIEYDLKSDSFELFSTRMGIQAAMFGYLQMPKGPDWPPKRILKSEDPIGFKAELDRRSACQRELLISNNQRILDAGIKSFVYSYAGAGDSGNFEEVKVVFQDGREFDIGAPEKFKFTVVDYWFNMEEIEGNFHYFLCCCAYALVYSNWPGYENNEGGEGEVHWNAETGLIRLNHTNFFEDGYTALEAHFQSEPVERTSIWG